MDIEQIDAHQGPSMRHKHTHKHEVDMGQGLDIQSLGGLGGLGGGSGIAGAGGLIGGVLLGALLGRNGGGIFGGSDTTSAVDTNAILAQLADVKASVPLAEAQVQLALAGVQSDITNQTLMQTISLKEGQCAIEREIAAIPGVVERTGWAVNNAVTAEGEKTRALIGSIDRDNLNRIITTQASELAELRFENGRQSDRAAIEIRMTNIQNQNQLQAQQQNQSFGVLANALANLTQVAHATNQAINIGGLQSASPTNTASNVNA